MRTIKDRLWQVNKPGLDRLRAIKAAKGKN
jgi:hypothetical protein